MTRAADYDSDDELPFNVGGIFGAGLPFDLSDDEAERVYCEMLERDRRRRPPGFAPWPDER